MIKKTYKSTTYSLVKYGLITLIVLLLGSYLFIEFGALSGEESYGNKISSAKNSLVEKKEYVTNFAKLNAEFYDIGINENGNMTGPFELLEDNGFLLIAKCGEVYTLKIINNRKLLESKQIGHIKNAACVDNFRWGIVKDSELFDNFLLVSYLEKAGDSYHLVLDKILKHNGGFDFNNSTRIFESTPNVPLKQGIHNHTFGRIAKKNESEIFLVIADYGATQYLDDDNATLGKIFIINIQTGVSSLFAKGFRSPGGLYYDQKNDLLWESEHGPVGGDEVNLVKEGNNYGWPNVTYGRSKGKASSYGLHHNGYAKPEYVFVPSVATSSIIGYPVESEITQWQGDLILGTLRERTLFRLKVDGQTIIYAEPIANLESRIRDLKVDTTGKIYLKTDNRQIIIIQVESLP